jgi:hypothetical protein
MTSTAPTLTLRGATPADGLALDRLAALDSRALPTGELLVAERDGRLAAAVSVQSLDAVADPFQRTDDAVALLRRQAVARRNARPARGRMRLVPHAA